MSITALIAKVAEAEPLVGDLRLRFDETALLGVPAHITVLAPFMAPHIVDNAVLARLRAVLARVSPFEFALSRLGRWPEVTYLAPEPARPFVELTRAVFEAFPEFPPYQGQHAEIVPHLTVSFGTTANAGLAEAELRPRLQARGPIRSKCTELALLENSSGIWKQLHVLPLATNDA